MNSKHVVVLIPALIVAAFVGGSGSIVSGAPAGAPPIDGSDGLRSAAATAPEDEYGGGAPDGGVDEQLILPDGGDAESGASRADVVKRANEYRRAALGRALASLRRLKTQVDDGVDPDSLDPGTKEIVASWLRARPSGAGDTTYSDVLRRAIDIIGKQESFGTIRHAIMPDAKASEICRRPVQCTDASGNLPYACYDNADGGTVALCDPYFNKRFTCQRVVLIHEYFHHAQLGDSTKKCSAGTTDEALRHPGCLAGLTSQLYLGEEDNCD